MFIILFAVLLLAWLGAFLVSHISGALIHLLLLFTVHLANCTSISAPDRLLNCQ